MRIIRYIVQEKHGDMWFDLYIGDLVNCRKACVILTEKNKRTYRVIKEV